MLSVCEPAGPGFDNPKDADPKMAAINSQCIHTASGGYGTRERNCHQNWIMGNCGESQIGQRYGWLIVLKNNHFCFSLLLLAYLARNQIKLK